MWVISSKKKKENVIKQNSWLPSEWTIHNFLCVGTDFGWQTPHESRGHCTSGNMSFANNGNNEPETLYLIDWTHISQNKTYIHFSR